MYDFKIAADDKATLYERPRLCLSAGRCRAHAIANMANAARFDLGIVPGLNWAGFYRAVGDELVLGPFQGRPACIRIPFGRGVCGAAASTFRSSASTTSSFPRPHRVRRASNSELVVPIVRDGELVAVLDLDSPGQ